MALITDRPEGIPSGNDLDNLDPEDVEGGTAGAPDVRTEVYLSGAHVFTLDRKPSGLEKFTFMVDVEVWEAGGVRYTGENGETQVPICKVRRIGDMYLPGTQRPPSKEELAAEQARAKAKAAAEKAEREEAERAEKEHNEPPMFNEDGDPLSDDAPRPPADDEDQDDGYMEGDGDDEIRAKLAESESSNVVAFSDGAKK